MIRLDKISGAGDLTVTFPAFKTTLEDGTEFVPSLTLAQPSSATQVAAIDMARTRMPARDEGEGDTEYEARAREMLDALLPGYRAGALDIASASKGLLQYLADAYHCAALIKGWDGFGTEEGPSEPELGNVLVAMQNAYVSQRFSEVVSKAVWAVSDEGNG